MGDDKEANCWWSASVVNECRELACGNADEQSGYALWGRHERQGCDAATAHAAAREGAFAFTTNIASARRRSPKFAR